MKEKKVSKSKGLRVKDHWFPIAYIVLFVLLSWYFLIVRNEDTMYFLQDRGWWNSTRLFWDDCMAVPGGLLAWLGSYLTQFFYYPKLGASMLIGLWLLTFGLAKWSFKVPARWSFLLFIPLAALLCSIIQLGYWVYIMKDVDYVFYHSLGLFAALLLSIPVGKQLPISGKTKQRAAQGWIIAVPALLFRPLGVYALLASAIVAIRLVADEEGRRKKAKTALLAVVTLLLTLWLVPLLETAGTTLMRPDQRWTYGFHFFELDDLRDRSLEIPFYLVFICPLLFPFIKMIKPTKLWQSQGAMALVALAIVLALNKRDFSDYNFHAELRMQRAVEECRWNDVLTEAAKAKGPVTREMVMFRDIALINRGELCNKRYIYNNESIPPATVSDSIHIRICDQAGDLIYYNYGETIFAIRRTLERCMHFGYSYYTMRILARCALINGEKDNVRKYLRILNRTVFQKKWARDIEPFLANDGLLNTDNRFRIPLRLYNEGSELVGTDDKYVELTTMKKWMYTLTNDPVAQEVALGAAMMMRDANCFWSQVQIYYNLHGGEHFPIHVQEAMLFGVYELKKQDVNLSFVKFDDRVIERFNAFYARRQQYQQQGMSHDMIGRALRPEFGDTYMWDYYVLRQIQTN